MAMAQCVIFTDNYCLGYISNSRFVDMDSV